MYTYIGKEVKGCLLTQDAKKLRAVLTSQESFRVHWKLVEWGESKYPRINCRGNKLKNKTFFHTIQMKVRILAEPLTRHFMVEETLHFTNECRFPQKEHHLLIPASSPTSECRISSKVLAAVKINEFSEVESI